jgi:hypothetical protein
MPSDMSDVIEECQNNARTAEPTPSDEDTSLRCHVLGCPEQQLFSTKSALKQVALRNIKHSYLQVLGDIKTNTFVPTPATMHLAMGKISVTKAASSATNAKSMGLKCTNAQFCIASATRKGSTEGITSSSTRSELTVLSLLGISERLTVLWMKYQKATEVLQRQSVKSVLK